MKTFTKTEVIDLVKAEMIKTYGGLTETTQGQKIDLPYTVLGIVQSALPDNVKPVFNDNSPIIEKIKRLVCFHFDLYDTDLERITRKKEIVVARYIAIWFIKKRTPLSLKKIGALFGGKDHSTIIYAIKQVDDLKATNRVTRKHIMDIEKLLLE